LYPELLLFKLESRNSGQGVVSLLVHSVSMEHSHGWFESMEAYLGKGFGLIDRLWYHLITDRL
jgi:hypothetical protein